MVISTVYIVWTIVTMLSNRSNLSVCQFVSPVKNFETHDRPALLRPWQGLSRTAAQRANTGESS